MNINEHNIIVIGVYYDYEYYYYYLYVFYILLFPFRFYHWAFKYVSQPCCTEKSRVGRKMLQ